LANNDFTSCEKENNGERGEGHPKKKEREGGGGTDVTLIRSSGRSIFAVGTGRGKEVKGGEKERGWHVLPYLLFLVIY